MWVKWELCHPGRIQTVALLLGSGKKKELVVRSTVSYACAPVEKGVGASWSARLPCPYSQPFTYNFISTEAILWRLSTPSGCHSDLITDPAHILRALIKQFAFFLPLFHLIERLQSLGMRLKDYVWIRRVPALLQLPVISWSGYLSVNISSLFSQVPGLLDLVHLALLAEE